MKRLPSFSWAKIALLVGIIHFLFIAGLGLGRHWGYLNSINDLGIFDQAVWGILNGEPFLNTNNPFGLPINWLGYHFNPILLVFAPFYLIYPAAEWLVLFQAAAISITAWPLYLIAKRAIQSERAAFLWTIVYLLNPFVLNAAAWDFHPVSLAAPFMALGVLAIDKRDPRLFGIACLFLLLIQEHFGISVSGFGILWWIRNRSLAPAVLAFCVGVAHTVLVFEVIMPALSPTGDHIMMGGNLGQLSRYGWLGGSLSEIAVNVFSNPLDVIKRVTVDLGGGKYIILLLVPLLATPLGGLEFLLPGLADLSANMLSSNPMPRGLFSYHSISLVPILVSAGIYGSSRIASKWHRFTTRDVAKMVLWATLLLGYFAAPFPLPYAQNRWQPVEWSTWPEKALSEIRNLIPPEVSVSAQANVGAQISQRYRMYPFPTKVNEVDVVVLRLASPTRRSGEINPAVIGSLGHHLLMPPTEYLAAVEELLDAGVYGVGYWEPPWLVLSKGSNIDPDTKQSVRAYLKQLRKEWGAGNHAGDTRSVQYVQ